MFFMIFLVRPDLSGPFFEQIFDLTANKATYHITLFLKTVLPMVYYFEIDLSVVLKQNDNFSITLVHI